MAACASAAAASAALATVSVQTGASGLPLGLNPVVDKDWDLFAGKVTLGGTYDLADSAFAPKALHVTAKRPGLKAARSATGITPLLGSDGASTKWEVEKKGLPHGVAATAALLDKTLTVLAKIPFAGTLVPSVSLPADLSSKPSQDRVPEPHQLAQDAVDLKAKLDDENLKKKLLKEAMVAIREAIRYREEQEEAERVAAEEAAEAERVAAEEAAEAERLAAEEEQRRLEDAEDAEDDDFDGTRDGSDDDEDSDDDDSICSGDASVRPRLRGHPAEEARGRGGRRGRGLRRRGLRVDDDDDDAASPARRRASVRGDKDDDDASVRGGGDDDDDASVASLASGDASVLGFRRRLGDEPEDASCPRRRARALCRRCSSSGPRLVPPGATVTADHKFRHRDAAIDEDGDIAAQTAKCVRTIRDVSKKLAPVKIALREFQGRKFVVDGGKVTTAGKPAVYGNTIAVDRGLWDALAVEQQDAVLDAGAVVMRGSAPATEMLTVLDVGSAARRGKVKRRARGQRPGQKKLSAVVRQERGCTH
ncbi:hypothetical protein JL721_11265 [Aureococcus anophagefferens]|nr:hypothetical protein JL721_11265 [Aureococcus anophagefferens]